MSTAPSQGALRHHVGVDVASVLEVESALERFGPRYTERVYTAHERTCCEGPATSAAASYAGRFAAKEAVAKVLPLRRDVALPWQAIEIRRDAEGALTVALHGPARELAAQGGIVELAVSITHERELAAAVALALSIPTTKEYAQPMSPEDQVRTVLTEHARLPVSMEDVGIYDDLFQRGMTSHASVNVMLALEEAFDIEFPDVLLRKSTFESIAAIQAAIESLVPAASA